MQTDFIVDSGKHPLVSPLKRLWKKIVRDGGTKAYPFFGQYEKALGAAFLAQRTAQAYHE